MLLVSIKFKKIVEELNTIKIYSKYLTIIIFKFFGYPKIENYLNNKSNF